MITKELVAQWAEQSGFHSSSGVIRTVHSNGSWVAVNDELTDLATLAAAHGAEAMRERIAAIYSTADSLPYHAEIASALRSLK